MAENLEKNEKKNETNNCSVIIDSLMKGMDSVLATKTVVGEPTKIGDMIIVPLVDVSFGVGAGASIGGSEGKKCGGAGGLAGKMSPNSVLVIRNGHTKLVNIKNQDTMTKIFDLVPDVLDRFSKKDKEFSDEDVINAAFSNDEE